MARCQQHHKTTLQMPPGMGRTAFAVHARTQPSGYPTTRTKTTRVSSGLSERASLPPPGKCVCRCCAADIQCAFVSGCAYTELANGTCSPPPPKKMSIEAIRGTFVFVYIPASNATAIEWITQQPSRSPSSWRRPVCILTPPQISRCPSLEVG